MNSIIISSRIRLARNLKNYPFPHRLSQGKAKEVVERVREALAPVRNSFKEVKPCDLDRVTELYLVENHIISPDMTKNKSSVLFAQNDGKAQILVNEEDHVRIQTVFEGDAINEAYELANRLDDLLYEQLDFAFSEKYGYLTACLTNTGTGLRASYMLHLPMLEKTDNIKALQNEVARFGMVIRGVYGEGSEPLGSLYQVSNQITLGKSEREIIEDIKNVSKQIIKKEEELRNRVKNDKNFEDMVYRSLGILKFCRKISGKEATEHLSNVKLGAECGIIKDANDNIYNMMVNIQTGSLCKREGNMLTPAERDIKRACYLNENL